MWLRNFNHRYNVALLHLHALSGVGNLARVIRVSVDRL
jgi:hypothetical protein